MQNFLLRGSFALQTVAKAKVCLTRPKKSLQINN
jgi:hypothetical protein